MQQHKNKQNWPSHDG